MRYNVDSDWIDICDYAVLVTNDVKGPS